MAAATAAAGCIALPAPCLAEPGSTSAELGLEYRIPSEHLSVLPKRLPYRDGEPPPAFYHLEERRPPGAWIVGTALGGAGHLMASVVAAGDGLGNRNDWLFVPVAGPFVAMGFDTRAPEHCDDAEEPAECALASYLGEKLALLLDGGMQIAGAILVPSGLLRKKKKYWVRDDHAWLVLPRADPRTGRFQLVAQGAW